MSWKKYFKTVNLSPLTNAGPADSSNSELKYSNYASTLPEVYVGHANRVERYSQYENMDVDSEVNAALDILAEFCTQLMVRTEQYLTYIGMSLQVIVKLIQLRNSYLTGIT